MTEATLDPQARALLDDAAAADLPPVTEISVADARQRLRDTFITDAPLPDILLAEERQLATPRGSFPIRRYRPREGVLPLVMLFHGGGWTLNDLDTHERVCRRLANACQTVVISVGFRRSPEFPYPTQVEDCFLATAWATQHAVELAIDPRRVGLFGDSSGGANVAAVSLLARDRGFPDLRMQCLLYPVTDAPSASSPSYEERGTGYVLDAPTMLWFWDKYTDALDHVDLDDPYLCPLRASDLSGLPGGIVVTAEFDPLRDEGRRFAERLRAAGNDVDHHHVADLMHNFLLQTDDIARADDEVSWIFEQIRSRLTSRSS
jgi:acetyl esterase